MTRSLETTLQKLCEKRFGEGYERATTLELEVASHELMLFVLRQRRSGLDAIGKLMENGYCQ